MSIRQITYPTNKNITALKVQDAFLWVAFDKNNSNNCIIEKQFATEPTQTFFTLTRAVDKVVKMDADGTKLYVAYEDETYFGEFYSLTNPLTSFTTIAIPSGVVEFPVDIFVNGSYVYFLTPGNISGENAKIIKYNTSGVFQEEIDLTKSGLTIYNAGSMSMDAIGDIYIVTYTDPATVVRVFEVTGGWDFAETVIV